MTTSEPAEVAARSNFWTMSIKDLDDIIDQLEARIKVMSESGRDSKPRALAGQLRGALTTVRSVRDVMLAENYDANRKDEGVTSRAR